MALYGAGRLQTRLLDFLLHSYRFPPIPCLSGGPIDVLADVSEFSTPAGSGLKSICNQLLLQLLSGNWPAEQIALELITVHMSQGRSLVLGLHSFDHRLQVKTLGDADNGRNERKT